MNSIEKRYVALKEVLNLCKGDKVCLKACKVDFKGTQCSGASWGGKHLRRSGG